MSNSIDATFARSSAVTTYLSPSPLLPLWKRQTNACHLVAGKHVSRTSLHHLPHLTHHNQSTDATETEVQAEAQAEAAPRPELLKPRGLNKWASFMHLIISDCSDRIEYFAALLLHSSVYALQSSVVVVLLFCQAEVVNEKRVELERA